MIGSLFSALLITLATALGGVYTNSHGYVSNTCSDFAGFDHGFHWTPGYETALTPPASYDYAVMPLWSQDLDDFAWGSSYHYDTQEGKLDDYIHFDFITATDTYLADTILFQEQHGHVSATMSFQLPTSDFNYSYANDDYYAGLGAIGSDDINSSSIRWQITFINTSTHDYKLIFDVSSNLSNAGHFIENKNYDTGSIISRSVNYLYISSLYNNELTLPAFSIIEISTQLTTVQRFLDAFYIKDLGLNPAYGAGLDDGYDNGYDNGYLGGLDDANQPWTLMDGLQTLLGAGLNSIFIFLSLDFFGIELSTILAILLGGIMLIWVLKLLRG